MGNAHVRALALRPLIIMKLCIAYPAMGTSKNFEVDDERKLRVFFEKRIGQEVEADSVGDEWKGYVFRITGGKDKQGFAMMQGVLTTNRVRLLLSDKHSNFRPKRKGERRRKSVRGCIVDSELSLLSLIIVKKGDGEIPGLTDISIPCRLGPIRANKIRRLFNLTREDDVTQYAIMRPVGKPKEGKKQKTRAPKIQRLITPVILQRRRHKLELTIKRREKSKREKAEYEKLLAVIRKEANEKCAEIRRRRALRESKKL